MSKEPKKLDAKEKKIPLTAKEKKARLDDICQRVSNGETLREIAEFYECTSGSIMNWTTETKEGIEQYTRAREVSADHFESEIITAATTCDKDSAAADRVKIDALKWVAARRAPKKYSEKTAVDHTSSDGSMSPEYAKIERVIIEKKHTDN